MIEKYKTNTSYEIEHSSVEVYGIKDASTEFIYLRANLHNLYRSVTIKCSPDNFNCEYDED